jgi:hypothetical protein
MGWHGQVSGREASQSTKSAAQKLGHGRATLALELVGYDKDLSAAMKYAFGNAFICKVAFPPSAAPQHDAWMRTAPVPHESIYMDIHVCAYIPNTSRSNPINELCMLA